MNKINIGDLVIKRVRAPQLTRDNLPARHKDEECRKADRATTVGLLIAKLHSEAEEIANDLTNAEEYGDLIETLFALGELNGVKITDIFAAAEDKRRRKGGLVKGNLWVSKEFMHE